MTILRPALLCLILLCGCARVVDSERLAICRAVLPALHAAGAEIRETRVSEAADRRGVRIDYAVREPNTEARATYSVCRFGEPGGEGGRHELTSVETDGRALGEARFLFLKRFWLPARLKEAEAKPFEGVPQLPAGFAYGLQQAINAFALCAIYGLLATAYSLIYGLIGRINLAFGEIAVIGGYGAFLTFGLAAASGAGSVMTALAIALVAGALLAALWSAASGKIIIAPLHARHRRGQPILIATIALAIAIQEGLRLTQGARERWMHAFAAEPIALARADAFVVTATAMQIAVAVLALAAAAAVLIVMRRSQFGRDWRAFADDPLTAALFGVSQSRVLARTFALGGALAGLAGWIMVTYYGTIGPFQGTLLGLKALVAAVLGGIGSLPGAFLGGIAVGLIETVWSAYFDLAMREIVLFVLLVALFVLRPGGLFGFAGPNPRDV